MATHRRLPRIGLRRTLGPLALGSLLVLAACGGGGDDTAGGDAGGGDAPATTGTPPTTAPPTTAPAGGGSIEGTWVADAGEILEANTANVGGTGPAECSGTITMTFTADRYERDGNLTCAVPGLPPGTAIVETSGSYTTDGDVLTVSDTTSSGTIEVAGISLPFPDAFGDGSGTYEVSGDELRISFEDPSVGSVTQTYRRS